MPPITDPYWRSIWQRWEATLAQLEIQCLVNRELAQQNMELIEELDRTLTTAKSGSSPDSNDDIPF